MTFSTTAKNKLKSLKLITKYRRWLQQWDNSEHPGLARQLIHEWAYVMGETEQEQRKLRNEAWQEWQDHRSNASLVKKMQRYVMLRLPRF